MRASVPHLKKRADFLRVAGARRKCAAPGLVLQVAAQPVEGVADPLQPRVGFTASKKVGNAVRRNRARRRLRAAVAALLPGHALAGHDYVLIARDGTAARPWQALLSDLEGAMRRLRAWSDPAQEGGP